MEIDGCRNRGGLMGRLYNPRRQRITWLMCAVECAHVFITWSMAGGGSAGEAGMGVASGAGLKSRADRTIRTIHVQRAHKRAVRAIEFSRHRRAFSAANRLGHWRAAFSLWQEHRMKEPFTSMKLVEVAVHIAVFLRITFQLEIGSELSGELTGQTLTALLKMAARGSLRSDSSKIELVRVSKTIARRRFAQILRDRIKENDKLSNVFKASAPYQSESDPSVIAANHEAFMHHGQAVVEALPTFDPIERAFVMECVWRDTFDDLSSVGPIGKEFYWPNHDRTKGYSVWHAWQHATLLALQSKKSRPAPRSPAPKVHAHAAYFTEHGHLTLTSLPADRVERGFVLEFWWRIYFGVALDAGALGGIYGREDGCAILTRWLNF
jgi:hypothetical protein